MKILITILSLGLGLALSAQAGAANVKRAKSAKHAAKTKKAGAKKKSQTPPSNVHTNHNFDDHGVTGEYQMPDEALAKVENEKTLSDLLGVRKHFKDRLAEASEQE